MPSLSALLLSLADLTETEPRLEAKATARALRDSAGQAFPIQPASALGRNIRLACGLPGAHPCAALVHQAQDYLAWADSPAAAQQPLSLAAIKSVATLLGPDGPILSLNLRFGLFYQAPDSYYPLHAHEAAETYTLLSGNAHWQAGDRRLTLGAGDAVHHPAQMPHAMRAGPDGFLAIWRWSGDVSFDSYRMLPDPDDTGP